MAKLEKEVATTAEGDSPDGAKKKPPTLVKRRDSESERSQQANASRGEVEETIKRIASHRGIIGTVITDKDCVALRSSLDKVSTQVYAAFVTPLAQRAKIICLNHDLKNPLTHLRIRTTTTEIIVTPDDDFYLIAVQKTSHAIDAT